MQLTIFFILIDNCKQNVTIKKDKNYTILYKCVFLDTFFRAGCFFNVFKVKKQPVRQ